MLLSGDCGPAFYGRFHCSEAGGVVDELDVLADSIGKPGPS